MAKQLNDRQEKFCIEFAASGNAYQAAIAAGYSEAYARGNVKCLLENESIKSRLEELYADHRDKRIADAEELRKTLTSIIRQETEEEVVVVEGTGNGYSEARIVDKHASTKDQLKAIELLARMGGMFNDRVGVDVTTPVVIMGYEDVKE